LFQPEKTIGCAVFSVGAYQIMMVLLGTKMVKNQFVTNYDAGHSTFL